MYSHADCADDADFSSDNSAKSNKKWSALSYRPHRSIICVICKICVICEICVTLLYHEFIRKLIMNDNEDYYIMILKWCLCRIIIRIYKKLSPILLSLAGWGIFLLYWTFISRLLTPWARSFWAFSPYLSHMHRTNGHRLKIWLEERPKTLKNTN